MHEPDVVETFGCFFQHLPVNAMWLFYQCIDSPRTQAWHSTHRVGVKKLNTVLKDLHNESLLNSDGITNKSGRTSLVTRMAFEGVPSVVGMKIIGHKSEGAYARYDRSVDTKVRAALRTARECSTFGDNLKLEVAIVKTALKGKMDVDEDMSDQETPTIHQDPKGKSEIHNSERV